MPPAGIEPATFRFVAQHLNHCAAAVPIFNEIPWKNTVERDRPQVTLWRMRVGCRTKYRFELQGSINLKRPLKMGPIGCPETSVTNYHHTLSNIPEEWRYVVSYVWCFDSKWIFLSRTWDQKTLCWHYCGRSPTCVNWRACAYCLSFYTVILPYTGCCIHFHKTHENIVSAVSVLE